MEVENECYDQQCCYDYDLEHPVDPKSIDALCKNISNIVSCIGWCMSPFFSTDPKKYEEQLQALVGRIAGSGTTALIDLSLANRPDIMKTINYIWQGGSFNPQISNKKSNKDVEDLLKCTKYSISFLGTVLKKSAIKGVSDFIGIAMQVNAVYHAAKNLYCSGAQRQSLIRFAETSVLLAFMVKMSVFKAHVYGTSKVISGAIDMLKLTSSVQGVRKFVYDYLEYKDQTEIRAQREIKDASKDCEVSSSSQKHYNLSGRLQLRGG